MTTYKFRKGSRLSGDADAVGKALEGLRVKHGELTPQIVEKAARSTRSPLHDQFEWDDTAAALEHRLGQASHLIICTVVIDDPVMPKEHQAFVRVEVEEAGAADEVPVRRSAYQRTVDVMSDAQMREQVILRALREAEAWQRRYEDLVELADIIAAIKKTKRRLKKQVAA